jgi:hypothetical protein
VAATGSAVPRRVLSTSTRPRPAMSALARSFCAVRLLATVLTVPIHACNQNRARSHGAEGVFCHAAATTATPTPGPSSAPTPAPTSTPTSSPSPALSTPTPSPATTPTHSPTGTPSTPAAVPCVQSNAGNVTAGADLNASFAGSPNCTFKALSV